MRKMVMKWFVVAWVVVWGVAFEVAGLEALDTQPATDGRLEGALMKAQVRRGVLTVQVAMRNVSGGSVEPEIRFGTFYYTDMRDKKKYYPLKDADGLFIAGPRHNDWEGGTFKTRIPGGGQHTLWIKFPAPPEDTPDIDIFVPGFLPFEAIAVQR